MDSQETSPKASQTEKPTSAQGGSASGGNPILWVVLGVVVLAVAGGIWYAVAQSNGSTNAANNTANANTVVNNSNAAANTNADSYAGWKTYRNTKYSYTIQLPGSWGRLSEFDGSYDLNINDPNTQNTGYVVFGSSEEDEEIVILIHEKTSVQVVISADPHSNSPATEYLTPNSIPGKFASYGLGNTWPEAYLFQHSSDVVEIGVLKSNTNTKLVVDSLQLQ